MKKHLSILGLAVAISLAILAPTDAFAACGGGSVYVFEMSWCPYCMKIKQMLSRSNIPYKTVDITNNYRARAFMAEKFNTTAVPVTVIDNAYVIGFNEGRLRQLLCLN